VNLFGITANVISAVNPLAPVQLQYSLGTYTTTSAGKRVPNYSSPPTSMSAQVQPLSSGDLRLLDSLNLGGASRAIYVYGKLQSVIRLTQQGGDLITMPDGTIYLTVLVMEQWSDWARVAAKLQNGS
jgi:hypothetical protein